MNNNCYHSFCRAARGGVRLFFILFSGLSAPMVAAQNAGKVDSVEVMAERLHQRLQADPNDIQGWVLLAKSYHYLQQWDKAGEAFAQAKKLGYQGNIPSLEKSSSRPVTLPGWQQDAWVSYINNSVLSQPSESATVQAVPVKSAPVKPVHTKATDVHIAVSVDDSLRKKYPADSAVFVFARDAENPGPPLAVARFTLATLPAELSLGDRQAMLPSHRLSQAHSFVVGVRLSVSGSPMGQAGDPQALSATYQGVPADPVILHLSGAGS